MNKIEKLLELKKNISTKDIMNSVTISKSYWKNAQKKEYYLAEKQEQNKLKPTLELYETQFTI